ncbi:hypothetical protein HD598_001216 [Neomicrococcus aestuarii]|uniref:Uncharacterized protein n=1 Tax=Neomicrococcus aestuarii TaxID=556325 RepID=A0A7W8TTB5_9MICC|nr:hypothetical protein [Neomicrococcus aestuarii]MBB5512529.1 hypothetical protein [Neomicrococcus aestuarii]
MTARSRMSAGIKAVSSVALLGVAALLAGCQSDSADLPALVSSDGADQAVAEARYAIYISPPSRLIEGSKVGQAEVILVTPEGETSRVLTAGMELGRVAFHDEEVVFSDASTDFTVTADHTDKLPSTKADSQVALFEDVDGTRVAVYNNGFLEDGYSSHVVVTEGDKAETHTVEGNYFIAAQCGDTVYGLSRATGHYSVTDVPEREPMMLAQLSGTSDGAEKVIGTSLKANEGAVVPNAPCVDGVIYYISNAAEPGKTPKPVVSMWDTTTGKYRELSIAAVKSEKPIIREDGTGLPQVSSTSVIGNKLTWFGAEDGIMQTDLTTGKTTRLFTVQGKTTNSAYSQTIISQDKVTQLVDNADGSEIEIIEYAMSDGHEISRVTLKGLSKRLSADFQIFGFDAR